MKFAKYAACLSASLVKVNYVAEQILALLNQIVATRFKSCWLVDPTIQLQLFSWLVVKLIF